MFELKNIPEIKLVVFTGKNFWAESPPSDKSEREQDIEEYFKHSLVEESDAVFRYTQSIGKKKGTLLLFYYDKEVVAHAIYIKSEKIKDPKKYKFNVYVDPESVTYIEKSYRPAISNLFLKEGVPLKGAQSPRKYDASLCDKYFSLLDGVKPTNTTISKDEEKDEEEDERIANGYSSKYENIRYSRSMTVRDKALERAEGICDLCSKPAPFENKDGNPYLESHHIVFRSQGGKDSLSNVLALCPNCHRKVHVLKLEKDIEFMRKKAKNYLNSK
ncbi:MAG: HNH endonuclease [bacterium]